MNQDSDSLKEDFFERAFNIGKSTKWIRNLYVCYEDKVCFDFELL